MTYEYTAMEKGGNFQLLQLLAEILHNIQAAQMIAQGDSWNTLRVTLLEPTQGEMVPDP